MFLKLLVKQNSAIGASAPVVDPVVQMIEWIAIRRDLLKSLLPDTVQMDPHPGRRYTNKGIHKQSEKYYLVLSRVRINPVSINIK